jgi:hypothetical protein
MEKSRPRRRMASRNSARISGMLPARTMRVSDTNNASFGRFWSVDPGGIRTANPWSPTSWNRYAYVNGDPINRFDPTGLYDCTAEEDPDCPADPDPNPTGGGAGDGGVDPTVASRKTHSSTRLHRAYQFRWCAPTMASCILTRRSRFRRILRLTPMQLSRCWARRLEAAFLAPPKPQPSHCTPKLTAGDGTPFTVATNE